MFQLIFHDRKKILLTPNQAPNEEMEKRRKSLFSVFVP